MSAPKNFVGQASNICTLDRYDLLVTNSKGQPVPLNRNGSVCRRFTLNQLNRKPIRISIILLVLHIIGRSYWSVRRHMSCRHPLIRDLNP